MKRVKSKLTMTNNTVHWNNHTYTLHSFVMLPSTSTMFRVRMQNITSATCDMGSPQYNVIGVWTQLYPSVCSMQCTEVYGGTYGFNIPLDTLQGQFYRPDDPTNSFTALKENG